MSFHRGLATLLVVGVLASGTTGCMVYGPPRPGVVYVSLRPPALRREVIPATPGVGFVWLAGYWGYRGAAYAWVPGRWERPAAGMHSWVAHRWVHDRNGWYLVQGHWR